MLNEYIYQNGVVDEDLFNQHFNFATTGVNSSYSRSGDTINSTMWALNNSYDNYNIVMTPKLSGYTYFILLEDGTVTRESNFPWFKVRANQNRYEDLLTNVYNIGTGVNKSLLNFDGYITYACGGAGDNSKVYSTIKIKDLYAIKV